MTYSKIINYYFFMLALVLPATSYIVFPSIKGTTPAFLISLASVVLVLLLSFYQEHGYNKDWIIFICAYVGLLALSQFGLSFTNYFYFENVRLVDPTDSSVMIRKSIFTQSLYLVAAASVFIFVKRFYNERWDKPIFIGVMLLVGYGFYEFFYYLIFHENGDFISNRIFGDGLESSGSLFQQISVGSLTIMRMKSLTGEPSMLAFTLLPFWIYSIHKGKVLLQTVIFVALLLTTSTTAFIGIAIYFIIRIRYYGLKDKFTFIMVLIITSGIAMYWKQANFIINSMIVDKLYMRNFSGLDRFDSFSTSLKFFSELPIINVFFGVGFGTIRSTDMFSTLLVNCGIVGVIIFTALFFYPVFKLKRNTVNIGLKACLIVVFISMMISVSEFSYLPTWLFLGIAYNQLRAERTTLLTQA